VQRLISVVWAWTCRGPGSRPAFLRFSLCSGSGAARLRGLRFQAGIDPLVGFYRGKAEDSGLKGDAAALSGWLECNGCDLQNTALQTVQHALLGERLSAIRCVSGATYFIQLAQAGERCETCKGPAFARTKPAPSTVCTARQSAGRAAHASMPR
jgi:hypothetical protein